MESKVYDGCWVILFVVFAALLLTILVAVGLIF